MDKYPGYEYISLTMAFLEQLDNKYIKKSILHQETEENESSFRTSPLPTPPRQEDIRICNQVLQAQKRSKQFLRAKYVPTGSRIY